MPELAIALGALTRQASVRLARAGISDPRRQALRIWAELNRVNPGAALLDLDVDVHPSSASHYQQAVERHAAGEPLNHVTGWAGFRHLWLRSDKRALIPRPETEGLVQLLLQRTRRGRVVDIGTGSGCIALSLALEGGFADVVGVDCSADALTLACENRALVNARVELVRGDLCAGLRSGCLDALISNPPYLTAAEYAGLDRSV